MAFIRKEAQEIPEGKLTDIAVERCYKVQRVQAYGGDRLEGVERAKLLGEDCGHGKRLLHQRAFF